MKMGTSVAATNVDELQETIRIACKMLEEVGYDSVIIIASEERFMEIGSAKGRKFLEDHPGLTDKFFQYCQVIDADMIEEDGDGDDDFPDTVTSSDQENKDMDTKQDVLMDKEVVLTEIRKMVTRNQTKKLAATEKGLRKQTDSDGDNKTVEKALKPAVREQPLREQPLKEGLLKCDLCEKKYCRKEDLVIHRRIHTGETPFRCSSCDKAFRSRKLLKNHVCGTVRDIKRRPEFYNCDLCEKKYRRNEDLVIHKRLHTGETPFICPVCRKGFRSRSYLRRHAMTHNYDSRSIVYKSGEKKGDIVQRQFFKCDLCEKKYARKDELRYHQQVHTGETPFLCLVCGKAFARLKYLKRHGKTHPADSTYVVRNNVLEEISASDDVNVASENDAKEFIVKHEIFSCDHCEKTYRRKEDLVIHVRSHTGEAPYMCNVCGNTFRSKKYLRNHRAVHSTDLPFICDVCGRLFARSTGLIRHKNQVHSSKTPFVCGTCGRGFKDPSSFRIHELRHTGEKRHFCEICGAGFLRLFRLTAHIRKHTGEKPFACRICEKSFRLKQNLITHRRRKHANEIGQNHEIM